MIKYALSGQLQSSCKIRFSVLFVFLLMLLHPYRMHAQNTTGNAWINWVAESGGANAIAYNAIDGRVVATLPDSDSYGLGNDRRGYIYYADNLNSVILSANPTTKTLEGSFGYTSGGASIIEPHSFKSFYVSATNKYYLVVSNVGQSINTEGIVTILDVTNPAAMTFVKNIVVPAATSTGTRATGMELVQTNNTSAATKLYIAVDDGEKNDTAGIFITIADPLHPTPVIASYTTRYNETDAIRYSHSISLDTANNKVYISGYITTGGIDTAAILSFSTTGTPTYNIYKALDGDGTEPGGFHTMSLNRAGTQLYTGSFFDAGGNRAYRFAIPPDKTAETVTVISHTAKSAVLNYDGNTSGFVIGVNILPDDSKLYAILGENGPGYTARIYDLHTTGLTTNSIVQNPAGTGNASFFYFDPHSYAHSLHDFGDAPSTYGIAAHFLNNSGYLQDRLRIGATIDGDTAALASVNFDSDDIAATPKASDEDGISATMKSDARSLYYGMTGTYSISGIPVNNTTTETATLFGWIDFNHDGIFQSTEGTSAAVPANTPLADLSWTIPATVTTGTVNLRLRLSTDPGLTISAPASFAFDGEAEDYRFAGPVVVTGSVFNDVNNSTILEIGETGTNAGTNSYAYMVIGGIIVDSAQVHADGYYSFANAPQNANAATVVIGSNNLAPGTASSSIINIATAAPAGWIYTGSSTGTITNGMLSAIPVTLATTAIAELNFGIRAIAVLPIHLQNLNGVVKNCNTVLITWTVSTATDFGHFDIQRSTNGVDFEKIASAAYDAAKSGYSFSESIIEKGKYQYRLNMIDKDGTNSYSPALSLRIDCKGNRQVTIFPNPANDQVIINGLLAGEKVKIYNTQSQLVYSGESNLYQLKVDMAVLPGGSYFIVVTDKAGQRINKSIIVKAD